MTAQFVVNTSLSSVHIVTKPCTVKKKTFTDSLAIRSPTSISFSLPRGDPTAQGGAVVSSVRYPSEGRGQELCRAVDRGVIRDLCHRAALDPASLWPCSPSLCGIALQRLSSLLSQQHAQKHTHTHCLCDTHSVHIFTDLDSHTHTVTHIPWGKARGNSHPPPTHSIPIAESALCIHWLTGQLVKRGREKERERERGWWGGWEEGDGDSKRQRDYKEKPDRYRRRRRRRGGRRRDKARKRDRGRGHVRWTLAAGKTQWNGAGKGKYRNRKGSGARPPERKRVSELLWKEAEGETDGMALICGSCRLLGQMASCCCRPLLNSSCCGPFIKVCLSSFTGLSQPRATLLRFPLRRHETGRCAQIDRSL